MSKCTHVNVQGNWTNKSNSIDDQRNKEWVLELTTGNPAEWIHWKRFRRRSIPKEGCTLEPCWWWNEMMNPSGSPTMAQKYFFARSTKTYWDGPRRTLPLYIRSTKSEMFLVRAISSVLPEISLACSHILLSTRYWWAFRGVGTIQSGHSSSLK